MYKKKFRDIPIGSKCRLGYEDGWLVKKLSCHKVLVLTEPHHSVGIKGSVILAKNSDDAFVFF